MLPQFEVILNRMLIQSAIVDALQMLAYGLCLYYAVRYAIKHGIRDSGLLSAVKTDTRATRPTVDLPDMRAD